MIPQFIFHYKQKSWLDSNNWKIRLNIWDRSFLKERKITINKNNLFQIKITIKKQTLCCCWHMLAGTWLNMLLAVGLPTLKNSYLSLHLSRQKLHHQRCRRMLNYFCTKVRKIILVSVTKAKQWTTCTRWSSQMLVGKFPYLIGFLLTLVGKNLETD